MNRIATLKQQLSGSAPSAGVTADTRLFSRKQPKASTLATSLSSPPDTAGHASNVLARRLSSSRAVDAINSNSATLQKQKPAAPPKPTLNGKTVVPAETRRNHAAAGEPIALSSTNQPEASKHERLQELVNRFENGRGILVQGLTQMGDQNAFDLEFYCQDIMDRRAEYEKGADCAFKCNISTSVIHNTCGDNIYGSVGSPTANSSISIKAGLIANKLPYDINAYYQVEDPDYNHYVPISFGVVIDEKKINIQNAFTQNTYSKNLLHNKLIHRDIGISGQGKGVVKKAFIEQADNNTITLLRDKNFKIDHEGNTIPRDSTSVIESITKFGIKKEQKIIQTESDPDSLVVPYNSFCTTARPRMDITELLVLPKKEVDPKEMIAACFIDFSSRFDRVLGGMDAETEINKYLSANHTQILNLKKQFSGIPFVVMYTQENIKPEPKRHLAYINFDNNMPTFSKVFANNTPSTNEAKSLEETQEVSVSNIPPIYLETLSKEYLKDSQTKEYSGKNGIRRHTEAVIKNFLTHFAPDFEQVTGFSVDFMMKLLSLHDIGKGLALTSHQHASSKNIIKEKRDAIALSKADSNLISDIIAQDPLGEYFQNIISQQECVALLNNSYNKIQKYKPELTREQYFNLMSIYYRCDAGSYPRLQNKFLDGSAFRPLYQEKLDGIRLPFIETTGRTQANSTIVSRLYNDPILLTRDVNSWLEKHKGSFGTNPVYQLSDAILPATVQKILMQSGLTQSQGKPDDNIVAVFSAGNVTVPEVTAAHGIKRKHFVLAESLLTTLNQS